MKTKVFLFGIAMISLCLTGCDNNNLPNGLIEVNGVTFAIDEDAHTAKVIRKWGALYSGNITIPSVVTKGNYSYFVETIGEGAFMGCTELESISFEESSYFLTTIEEGAFFGCSSLKSIELPSSIVYIGTDAFRNCTNLTSVTLPANMGYKAIAMGMFRECTSLKSISISSQIENIWQGAFANCTSLETVYNDAEYPQNISGGKVFEGVDLSKCTLYVHVISRYKEADGWKEFGNILGTIN